MTLSEIFIVYLAVGAPFGVHFFLRERGKTNVFLLLVKSFFAGIGWIYYALRYLQNRLISAKNTSADFLRDDAVENASRNLQRNFAETSAGGESLSFFAFREMLERYIGLTLAAQNASIEEISPPESEIFRTSNVEQQNLQIAARCVHRRNLLRLAAHQIRARGDFLHSCAEIAARSFDVDDPKLQFQNVFLTDALLLTKTLYDVEATDGLRQIRENYEQKRQRRAVESVQENGRQEKDVWKTLQTEQSLKIIQRASPFPMTNTRD